MFPGKTWDYISYIISHAIDEHQIFHFVFLTPKSSSLSDTSPILDLSIPFSTCSVRVFLFSLCSELCGVREGTQIQQCIYLCAVSQRSVPNKPQTAELQIRLIHICHHRQSLIHSACSPWNGFKEIIRKCGWLWWSRCRGARRTTAEVLRI